MTGRWCDPDARVRRRWAIHVLGPVGVGELLALYQGTEAELVAFLPASSSTFPESRLPSYAWERLSS